MELDLSVELLFQGVMFSIENEVMPEKDPEFKLHSQ